MYPNLNEAKIENDGNYDVEFIDNSILSNEGISVYFRNLEVRLLDHINKADAVFGAIAWLTHEKIIKAIASKDNASIIVQKEDFLRPDINNIQTKRIKDLYGKIRCNIERHQFDNILGFVSVANDPTMDGVRCVGNHNRDKKPAFPRMHNKFLVFCNFSEASGLSPYAVWTGSFNFTKNATFSLENAVYIQNDLIARAYFNEFGQIAAMSEPLNWESDWSEPEWRIGT